MNAMRARESPIRLNSLTSCEQVPHTHFHMQGSNPMNMSRSTCHIFAIVCSVVAVISQNSNAIGAGLVALGLWGGYFFAYSDTDQKEE